MRFRPASGELLVEREIAVLVVAGDRKAEMREVHADLMRAAGLEFRLEQAEGAEALLQPERCAPRPCRRR